MVNQNMIPGSPQSCADLIPYIEAAGESKHVEAKGPMEWAGDNRASLTKDILACANSKNGGVIVIGKQQISEGSFREVGVSSEQAATFETTKVANWVNSHCDPSVNLTCYQLPHDDKVFIVITVGEFDDIPVICTKAYRKQSSGEYLLREGTIYTRTVNAESVQVREVEEWRHIIGLATTKKVDEMGSMLKRIMRGQPLLSRPVEPDPYSAEKKALEQLLQQEISESPQMNELFKAGSWTFALHPDLYIPDRWTIPHIEEVLKNSSVRIRLGSFPGSASQIHHLNAGIFATLGCHAILGLNKSGLFVYKQGFPENRREFQDPVQSAVREPDATLPPGKWIEFQWNLYLLTGFFWFMANLVHYLDMEESINYELSAQGIRGRKLVSTNFDIQFTFLPDGITKEAHYVLKKSVSVAELRSGWEEQCIDALYEFFRLFKGGRITKDTLAVWATRLKNQGL